MADRPHETPAGEASAVEHLTHNQGGGGNSPAGPTAEKGAVPMMDRPAYELVRLIEAALDDADQGKDTPRRPNRIAVWGIRMLLEPYGGKPHRWQWPLCFECNHQLPLHEWGPCDLCGCAMTAEEVLDGARDEALDAGVEEALRWDAEHRAFPSGQERS